MTISLPPAMAEQMEKVQKEGNRIPSELLREAWRQYFERRYAVYTPTKAEAAAIKKGRAAFDQGRYVTLSQLKDEMDAARHEARKKRTCKTP